MSITIFAGDYGSGKTELALNHAVQLAAAHRGRRVVLADLDITKPMFRSRQMHDRLAPLGVEVLSSAPGFEYADVPSISPAIHGAIEDPCADVVIDVGGDDTGARTLGRFFYVITAREYQMIYVINSLRPFSDDVEPILATMNAVEAASRLKITGIAANTNASVASTVGDCERGLSIALEVANRRGTGTAEVKFFAVWEGLFAANAGEIRELRDRTGVEYRIISRYMLPPWEE